MSASRRMPVSRETRSRSAASLMLPRLHHLVPVEKHLDRASFGDLVQRRGQRLILDVDGNRLAKRALRHPSHAANPGETHAAKRAGARGRQTAPRPEQLRDRPGKARPAGSDRLVFPS